MSLDDWARYTGLTYTDIAKLIPCSQPYPGMIASGRAKPSWKMACRIEEISNGLVPRTNWFEDRAPTVGTPKSKTLED